MKSAGLEWDSGNWPKCGKHGVSREEIAFLFLSGPFVEPDLTHSVSEERFKAIGPIPGGKWVFVVFTLRRREGRTMIRPVSARYMHAREIRKYGQDSEG